MLISHDKQFPVDTFNGQQPEVDYGSAAPSAVEYFNNQTIGSLHVVTRESGSTYTVMELWQKVLDQHLISDWRCIAGTLVARVSVADFTDGGAAVGTLVLTPDVPAGAFVLGSAVKDVVGFAGDTSATLVIGDGSDADRYNTSTYNVFATAAIPASVLTQNAPSGNRGHTSALGTVTLTVTTNSDFTACKSNGAGRATVLIYYII